MFINNSKFEKKVKESYKSFGVTVGLTEQGVYIVTGIGWMIEVDSEVATNEFLGKLVGVVGPLPRRGEFYEYQYQSSPQQTIETEPQLLGIAAGGRPVVVSLLTVTQNGRVNMILRDTSGALLLAEDKYALIKPDACEPNEDLPKGPVLCTGNWIVWYNDRMAIGLSTTIPRYRQELDVLRLLSGVDFTWLEVESNEIG